MPSMISWRVDSRDADVKKTLLSSVAGVVVFTDSSRGNREYTVCCFALSISEQRRRGRQIFHAASGGLSWCGYIRSVAYLDVPKKAHGAIWSP